MISRALLILVVIISFPVVSFLPPKAMAQAPSEEAKVLVEDVVQALKTNDTEKAQAHLSILNEQRAIDRFDNGQLKGINADKSLPCPAVDEGNGYCRGFHDGWRKTVLDRLD